MTRDQIANVACETARIIMQAYCICSLVQYLGSGGARSLSFGRKTEKPVRVNRQIKDDVQIEVLCSLVSRATETVK
jgi:hypothetical protein